MDKEKFRLDPQAKERINEEFYPQEDLSRVNSARPPVQARPSAKARRPGQTPPGRKRRPQQTPPAQDIPRKRTARVRKPPTETYAESSGYDENYEPENDDGKKRSKKRLAKLLFRIAAFCIAVILLNVMFFYYSGQIWFNEPKKRDYPVRGAVVSEKLGKIDWEKFAGQNISFVYIRATSGTSETDEQYSANRKGANHTDLYCGYYHDFDFRTDGAEQAEHFIDKLGDLDGKLRPMVRLTRYGVYRVYHKGEDEVRKQLQAFIDRIKEEYGRSCVIQCDKSCYEDYIRDSGLDKYTLWLISHFSEPDEQQTNWALWDYNPRVRTAVYEKRKKYYCMTVYRKGKSLNNFRKNFLM